MKSWYNYKKYFIESLDAFTFDAQIVDIILESIDNNQTIFICGNGGSASISNHFACDFSKVICNNHGDDCRYKVVSLVSNISTITAIANDICYEEIFSEQIKNHGKKGDILILISSSGNSKNIINALDVAKALGIITIGVCGFDGGYLAEKSDFKAYINSNKYGVIEDIHSIFAHYILYMLNAKINI